MGFPSEKKLKKMRARLEKSDPSRTLPDNATTVQKIKYKICEKFALHLMEHDLSQAELARQLHMDPARLNEVVKYKIDLFTIDKLIEFAEKLDARFTFEVA